ncbi:D-alanyl-D-alanine carboxypeptidase family protein [Solibacillus sp. FSL K6-1523]|uniref:D-alanyl-D-alanine carboxypeptidase family protein n=1 Tax=Solibacillus sp. FSL K6-1523 TaxID=2921471 RepID=UPI0030FA0560
MKKWFVVVILASFLLFNHGTVSAQGSSYAVIDAENGRVLLGSNVDERLPIASLTKIWTAIVVIENSELDEQVIISREADYVEGSSIYVEEGKSYSVEYLLYGLMMQSGNDAATALAEHVGGSVEGFAKLMNEKANYYGLTQTYFTNPTGLHHPDHLSSAKDTAKMLQIAMKNETFKKIASTTQYNEGAHWRNKHRLLHLKNGAVAGKTGFTKVAGRTLATYYERGEKKFVVVTLNSSNDWNVHQGLADEIDRTYKLETVADDGNYKKSGVTIFLEDPIKMLLKKGEKKQIRHIVYLSRHSQSKRAVWHVFLNDEMVFAKLAERK